MVNKVFVGCWISEDVRKRLKIACVLHNVSQGDVMELLLEHWLKKAHIKSEFKKLQNRKDN